MAKGKNKKRKFLIKIVKYVDKKLKAPSVEKKNLNGLAMA